jgi:U3 small nucleolar RNA-associated protein 13
VLQEQEVLRGQELENAVSDSDYAKAIQLAFELRRPHKLLDLFSQLARYYILVGMKSAALNY